MTGSYDKNDKKYEKFIKKESPAKEKATIFANWILDHTKIVMPLILIVCVLVTVFIALNANERASADKQAEMTAAEAVSAEAIPSLEGSDVPADVPLEVNAYPEVNELVKNYYNALADGDIAAAALMNAELNDDLAKIRAEELAKYIDHYETIDVYTQTGLDENSYVAYVCTEVKFNDLDTLIPGFQMYYISGDAQGNLSIKKDSLSAGEYEYSTALSLQDEVVDLNNKINVAYKDLVVSDKELEEFIAYMQEKINEDVGVVLAQMEQGDAGTENVEEVAAADETGAQAGGDTAADEGAGVSASVTTVKTARALDVVNIRSSDSENADRLDKAQIGQEFTVLEQKGNGWSRVKYNDTEAFIKSEFLEIISEEEVPADAVPDTAAANDNASAESSKVTVKETVRVRGEASTSSEILGSVYGGDVLELIEQQDNGWSKVIYEGETAYIKSEFLQN